MPSTGIKSINSNNHHHVSSPPFIFHSSSRSPVPSPSQYLTQSPFSAIKRHQTKNSTTTTTTTGKHYKVKWEISLAGTYIRETVLYFTWLVQREKEHFQLCKCVFCYCRCNVVLQLNILNTAYLTYLVRLRRSSINTCLNVTCPCFIR